MEDHMRTTAHGGNNKNLPWGGIPIVIFVGDDMQEKLQEIINR